MEEGHVDDGMIEIGDPTEEPSAAVPPPKVVIEFRERGVPWMLIPPLLIISAVGAVLGYHKLARMIDRPQPTVLARAPEVANPTEGAEAPAPSVETPVKPPEAPPVVIAQPVAQPASPPPVVVAQPVAPSQPPAFPPVPEPNPEPTPDPAAFPRVQGLGFDPKALEADRKPDAPADPALAPAGKSGQPEEPVRVAVPEGGEQPSEVNEEILPPDPRLARDRKAKRVVEALRAVELDRVRFHAELREICQRLKEASGPEILELTHRYESRVEPTSQQRAKFMLGPKGPYAGADRSTRINVLRSLGYPEPAILDDLFTNYEARRMGERGGPRNNVEAGYMAARSLLRYPPLPLVPPSRPVSSTSASPGPTALPSPAR
jgi:hypothetical protein